MPGQRETVQTVMVIYVPVWHSQRLACTNTSVASSPLGPTTVHLRRRKILCCSQQDTFSYCLWFQRAVFKRNKEKKRHPASC